MLKKKKKRRITNNMYKVILSLLLLILATTNANGMIWNHSNFEYYGYEHPRFLFDYRTIDSLKAESQVEGTVVNQYVNICVNRANRDLLTGKNDPYTIRNYIFCELITRNTDRYNEEYFNRAKEWALERLGSPHSIYYGYAQDGYLGIDNLVLFYDWCYDVLDALTRERIADNFVEANCTYVYNNPSPWTWGLDNNTVWPYIVFQLNDYSDYGSDEDYDYNTMIDFTCRYLNRLDAMTWTALNFIGDTASADFSREQILSQMLVVDYFSNFSNYDPRSLPYVSQMSIFYGGKDPLYDAFLSSVFNDREALKRLNSYLDYNEINLLDIPVFLAWYNYKITF